MKARFVATVDVIDPTVAAAENKSAAVPAGKTVCTTASVNALVWPVPYWLAVYSEESDTSESLAASKATAAAFSRLRKFCCFVVQT